MEKNTIMLDKLTSNLYLRTLEDGSSRGTFARLTKKDFTSIEVYELYKLALSYAVQQIEKSLTAKSEEESATFRNYAVKHIADAYAVIIGELKATSGAPETLLKAGLVQKKHVRAWIATGAFASLKTNYATCEREIAIKSTATLQRFVECDIADILNGRERLSKVKSNNAVNNAINKAQEKAAKATEKATKEAEKAAAEKPAKSAKVEKPAK